MLLFVRGFGDLLPLSSVALAPSLVRSPVQLWRPSLRVASFRGGGRCADCRRLLAAGLWRRCAAIWRMFVCVLRVPWLARGVLAACWPGLSVSASPVFAPAHVPVAARLIEAHLSSAR